MLKERIKTCLLVILITSSIIITFKMWFSEKLWPDGYNFFSNITKFTTSGKSSYYLSKENISNPEKIIVNSFETRNLYTPTQKEYSYISEPVLSIIKQSISGSEYSEANAQDWNTALTLGSVYISYPVAYDTALLCKIFDIVPKNLKTKSVKEFIIVPSAIQNNSNVSVYTKDTNSGKVYNSVITADSKAVLDIIENYANDSLNMLPYSFELNFDSTDNINVEQKVVIEPTVTLSLDTSKLSIIKSDNYLKDIYYNDNLSSRVLNAFGYNTTNTKSSLVDKNNTAVYAENFSTLKIYDDGLIEYKALDNTKGIPLSTHSASTLYDKFIACIEFVNNLWDATLPGEPLNINLTSDIVSVNDGNSFKITMDYYVNGKMVVCSDNGYHGVEIVVENGNIVEYRQYFKKFYQSENHVVCSSSIDAIDALFDDETIENGSISQLNIIYNKSGDFWYPVWAAKLNGNNVIINRWMLMNWKNIKTFLIILFLLVNIYLIFLSANHNKASMISDDSINEAINLLENNNIKIDKNIIPRNSENNNPVHLTDIYFSTLFPAQSIEQTENETKITLNYHGSDNLTNNKKVLQTLKSYGIDVDEITVSVNQNGLYVTSRYNGIPIFNNMMKVDFSEDKIILTGNWYQAKNSYMWKQTIPSYAISALISFISCPYRNKQITTTITDICYGYYAQTDNQSTDIKTISTSPCYRLTTDDGMMYYYSVIEGKFIK